MQHRLNMLKKVLTEDLVLFKGRHFPSTVQTSLKRYRATLGVGGNIGDSLRRMEKLLWALRRSELCDLVSTGPVLKNPPFGFTEQADFYNSVLQIRTNLQPRALLRYLLELERKFGRRRSFANAPRTMDIDIIFFEERNMHSNDLTLPHPAWHTRQSVVIPMAYMERK
jgi:2-amino-4-hydroxy-6-hydroxymethyldihydropteridine diphosphokinase